MFSWLHYSNREIESSSLRSFLVLLLKTLDFSGCRGLSRVPNPPLSNAVVVASVAECFEGLDAEEDEEDEY